MNPWWRGPSKWTHHVSFVTSTETLRVTPVYHSVHGLLQSFSLTNCWWIVCCSPRDIPSTTTAPRNALRSRDKQLTLDTSADWKYHATNRASLSCNYRRCCMLLYQTAAGSYMMRVKNHHKLIITIQLSSCVSYQQWFYVQVL